MCLHYPQKDSPIVLWIKNLKRKQKMGEERLIEGPPRINLCILLISSLNLGIKSVAGYLILGKHWVWFCEHKLLLTIILANRISEAQGSCRGLHWILHKQSNSTVFPPETQEVQLRESIRWLSALVCAWVQVSGLFSGITPFDALKL